MLIAQLAVLKVGCAYVPVDPKWPMERQRFVIEDCGARWILHDGGEGRSVWEAGVPQREDGGIVQWIDCARLSGSGELPRDNLGIKLSALLPAYVMYTSGSTGMPKGVVVPHRAVNRLVINNGYAQIEPTDCIAHCSNPAFDASTFEIWGALLNGARVLIVPQPIVLDNICLPEALREGQVTILWMTVGLFVSYLDSMSEVFAQIRYLLVGGDAVDPIAVRRLLKKNPPAHLVNGYGPTECTTFSATYLIESMKEGERSVPIGKPISNTQIYILDQQLRPVPTNVSGEIYIGGDGVALGYLNRPELAAERFIPNPFSVEPGARLYRSGDLGRWRADGNVEFLGRNDQQVKLRGFRIEPGEIEAQLRRDGQVKEALVVVREDVAGEKRLVAYVTPAREESPGVEELRARLQEALPEYMVPSAFVVLDSLPLTPNGKVDRRALPVPESGSYGHHEHEAPQGETEEQLAEIWRELLHVERVGRHDNFFNLGGHSLLAMQVMVRIRSSLSIDVPMKMLFESVTLERLARTVDESRQARLLEEIAAGGSEIDELLERVTSMPESQVRELIRDLRYGGKP
jgi:amino acid adenylation domain-containing protein